MSNKKLNTKQGHWILAKMGKKVLRPGGKELTTLLVDNLDIGSTDDIVEFAPGLGFTASMALEKNSKSYTGIELNEEAASILRKKIVGENKRIIIGDAADSTLDDGCADKVYGEAMLSMHADHKKSEIISEAHRILKKGGLYGIHELGLTPDDLEIEMKAQIQSDLAKVIKVNARPLTKSEWVELLEQAGFTIIKVETNPMLLLETARMIDDEGLFRTLKIAFNLLIHPHYFKRVWAMRKTFKQYQHHLNAIAIVVKKQ